MNDDNLDNLIRRKVHELDESYPDELVADDALWEEIISRKKQRQARRTIQWSVAATLLILITAGTLWRTFPTRHSHSQTLPEMTSIGEHEVLEQINKLCSGNNVSCHSPAFKELQEELKESSLSLMEIEKQISVFGRDANLLRAKTRIENHQVNIIRAMIQTL